jgi:hypothetical protein
MNFLWKQDIYNYLFVKEKHEDLLDEITSMQSEEYVAV